MADLVSKILEYETGELSTVGIIRLFAELIRTGEAWQLQGSYGRLATALIDSGVIDSSGTILKDLSKSGEEPE